MSELQPMPNPLAMKREEKLKVFTVVTVKKDAPTEEMKDKIGLILMATYTKAEAVFGAVDAMKQMGFDPAEYTIPYMIAERNVEDLAQLPNAVVPLHKLNTTPTPAEKTKEDMVAYVRYVADKAGLNNEAEQAVIEDIIKRFMKAKI